MNDTNQNDSMIKALGFTSMTDPTSYIYIRKSPRNNRADRDPCDLLGWEHQPLDCHCRNSESPDNQQLSCLVHERFLHLHHSVLTNYILFHHCRREHRLSRISVGLSGSTDCCHIHQQLLRVRAGQFQVVVVVL